MYLECIYCNIASSEISWLCSIHINSLPIVFDLQIRRKLVGLAVGLVSVGFEAPL